MTVPPRRPLANRLMLGFLAGIGGTIAMTMAMRRLEPRLPAAEKYPMPPREIVQQVVPTEPRRMLNEQQRQDFTMAAHFAYGALTGGLLALNPKSPSPAAGAAYGFFVWAASYLGWIPASRILEPATHHPSRRSALLVAVHLIWGAATALVLNELQKADEQLFMKGPARDAPNDAEAYCIHADR